MSVFAASTLAPAVAADPKAERLTPLVEEYYEELLGLYPILATSNGDHRFDDRWEIGIAPAHIERALELEQRYLKRALALSSDKLSATDRLTRELFLDERRLGIESHAFPGHLLPIDQFHSTPIGFAMLGGGGSIQPFVTVQDHENWLKRVGSWGRWVDQAIANMQLGMKQGVVQPRILIERALPTLEAQIVDNPRESVFFEPARSLSQAIGEEDRQRLEVRYLEMIPEQVVAPYRRLRDFVRDEYLPKTRRSVGISDLPNGREWYAHLVRSQASTTLSPDEIHRIGLAEVERLQRELSRARSRPTGEQFAETRGRQGPLLDGYRALRQVVAPRLPELFACIPALEFEIRPVEGFRRGSTAGASYVPGTPDGSRPGVFYVNAGESTVGTPSEALFLHEAIPGHHFQMSIQRELGELPRFRRFGHHVAFTEGWALYVEGLGQQLGLYRDREQIIRALQSELFRARRLVVDTGLHAMGWSRRQAIDYIGSANEVDRYIAIPGQALAYKIGQMRIQALRDDARDRLGDRFDLREFHEVVLQGGAMPLDILGTRVERWIAAARQGLSNP